MVLGFFDMSISGLENAPSYLCEYKAGTLRKAHVLSDNLFRDLQVRNLNVSNNLTVKTIYSDRFFRSTGNDLQIDGLMHFRDLGLESGGRRVCVGFGVNALGGGVDCSSVFEVIGDANDNPFVTVTRNVSGKNMGYAFGTAGEEDLWDFYVPGSADEITLVNIENASNVWTFTNRTGRFGIGIGTSAVGSITDRLTVNGNANISGILKLQPQSTPPANPTLGWIYVDSDSSELCFYNGTAWRASAQEGVCA